MHTDLLVPSPSVDLEDLKLPGALDSLPGQPQHPSSPSACTGLLIQPLWFQHCYPLKEIAITLSCVHMHTRGKAESYQKCFSNLSDPNFNSNQGGDCHCHLVNTCAHWGKYRASSEAHFQALRT